MDVMIFGHAPVGMHGELVTVEVDLRRGIPGVDIVGLPDDAVRESRERMRAAIAESEIMMDQKILAANQSGDVGKAGELEMQKVMVIQKSREDAEEKKRQIRGD